MRRFYLGLGLAVVLQLAASAEGRWQKTAYGGCLVWNAVPQVGETATWMGSCVNGKAEGKGVGAWSYENGGKRVVVRYDGEMREGYLHGRGTLYGPNGDRADGEWRRGKFHGKGSYRTSNGGRYVGSWRHGLKHGRGIYVSPNGDRYEGWWRADKKHGRGTYYFANGDRFQGQFASGKRQGIGKCFAKDTNRWVGCEMRDDQFVRWLE